MHEFSQICGPNSATLYTVPDDQHKTATAMDVGNPGVLFEYYFLKPTSNNIDCNSITTKQTISTSPTYPGVAHTAITTPKLEA